MPNVLEAVTTTMNSLREKDPDQPLHIGEAMACWTYLGSLKESVVMEQAALNTTVDEELRHILHKAIEMCNSQAKRLEDFMRREGVPLPPSSPNRPESDPDSIPLGVKLTDAEIANALALKASTAVIASATSSAQAVRNDVGLMWTEFQSEQLTFGVTLKNVMRNRGWLIIPPAFTPPGVPTT